MTNDPNRGSADRKVTTADLEHEIEELRRVLIRFLDVQQHRTRRDQPVILVALGVMFGLSFASIVQTVLR